MFLLAAVVIIIPSSVAVQFWLPALCLGVRALGLAIGGTTASFQYYLAMSSGNDTTEARGDPASAQV